MFGEYIVTIFDTLIYCPCVINTIILIYIIYFDIVYDMQYVYPLSDTYILIINKSASKSRSEVKGFIKVVRKKTLLFKVVCTI